MFLAGKSEVLKCIDDDKVALVHNIVFPGANMSETGT